MDFIDDLDVSIIANILVNMGIDISNLNDITDADDYEDTISTITASLEKLRNEEDPLYVLLELIAGDNEELVDFYFKMNTLHSPRWYERYWNMFSVAPALYFQK